MNLFERVSYAGTLIVLLVSGLAKVLAPGVDDFVSEGGQVALGGIELALALGIIASRRFRVALMVMCAVAALVGIVFHVVFASQGQSCGCLGRFGPRAMGPALAGALGAFSCLWLSFRVGDRHRVELVDAVVGSPTHRSEAGDFR